MAAAAEATDFSALNSGATELLRAIETYADVDDSARPSPLPGILPTAVSPSTEAATTTTWATICLILDLDGNDTYLGGGRTTAVAPVSVLVDMRGNDRYAPADSVSAGPGGAIAGYAIVDDRGGDDHYRAWRVGLGAGVFGVGCLIDRAGSDTLEAYTASEGAGFFGLGILADASGDDAYRVAQSGQGCGGPGGVR